MTCSEWASGRARHATMAMATKDWYMRSVPAEKSKCDYISHHACITIGLGPRTRATHLTFLKGACRVHVPIDHTTTPRNVKLTFHGTQGAPCTTPRLATTLREQLYGTTIARYTKIPEFLREFKENASAAATDFEIKADASSCRAFLAPFASINAFTEGGKRLIAVDARTLGGSSSMLFSL